MLAAQVQVMVRALRFYTWPVTSQHPTPTGEKWVGIPGVDLRRYSIGQPGNLKTSPSYDRSFTDGGSKIANLVIYMTTRDCQESIPPPSKTTYQGYHIITITLPRAVSIVQQ